MVGKMISWMSPKRAHIYTSIATAKMAIAEVMAEMLRRTATEVPAVERAFTLGMSRPIELQTVIQDQRRAV
jgi:hypothetical protein